MYNNCIQNVNWFCVNYKLFIIIIIIVVVVIIIVVVVVGYCHL